MKRKINKILIELSKSVTWLTVLCQEYSTKENDKDRSFWGKQTISKITEAIRRRREREKKFTNL